MNGKAQENGRSTVAVDRPLPADLEAERKLLACCMLGRRPADLPGITPASFSDPSHVKLFANLQTYFVQHVEFDGHLFLEQLESAGDLESVGGEAYLSTLIASEWSDAHVGYYSDIVADRALRRRLIQLHRNGERATFDTGNPVNEQLTIIRDEVKIIASRSPGVRPCSAGELLTTHPALRTPIVDGICRIGETVNLISASKVGKSWMAYGLLFAIAYGQRWLDTFECTAGRALLVDWELHPATLAYRLGTVARAMGLGDEWHSRIDVLALRGRSLDLQSLESIVNAIEPDRYVAVANDALYRALPRGISENDNAQVAQLFNRIDSYAEHLGAAWLNVHHSSKGGQSDKSVVDVGADAGSMARAADSHLILRPHANDGLVVLEGAVRSFTPIDPLCLKWEYPLWLREAAADPRSLRRASSSAELNQQMRDAEAKGKIVAALAGNEKKSRRTLWETGLSDDRLKRLLQIMVAEGSLRTETANVRGNTTEVYSLAPPERDVFD